ncbi:hypothetical protein V8G54_026801 [Vigna mungo]|uniref:Uncharacterized protein n=1 Tax=Vigna mungo TaxID=3915 RepID=A0AAQ3N125_VIGMU
MNGEFKLTTMVEMEEERRPNDEEGLFLQLLARLQELQMREIVFWQQKIPSPRVSAINNSDFATSATPPLRRDNLPESRELKREQRAQAVAWRQLSDSILEFTFFVVFLVFFGFQCLHLMHRLLPTTKQEDLLNVGTVLTIHNVNFLAKGVVVNASTHGVSVHHNYPRMLIVTSLCAGRWMSRPMTSARVEYSALLRVSLRSRGDRSEVAMEDGSNRLLLRTGYDEEIQGTDISLRNVCRR